MQTKDLIEKLQTTTCRIVDGKSVTAIYWGEEMPSLLKPYARRKKRATKKVKKQVSLPAV